MDIKDKNKDDMKIDLFETDRKRVLFRKALLGLVVIVVLYFVYTHVDTKDTKTLNPPPKDFISVLKTALNKEGEWKAKVEYPRDHCVTLTPLYDSEKRTDLLKITEYISPKLDCIGDFVKSEMIESKYSINMMAGTCICSTRNVTVKSKFYDDIKVTYLWVEE